MFVNVDLLRFVLFQDLFCAEALNLNENFVNRMRTKEVQADGSGTCLPM